MEETANIMPTVSAKYRDAVIAWPAFHRVGLVWVPGRATWDLWFKKWRCGRFFSEHFAAPLSA